MNEYTAHVQVPDAAIGAVLHDMVLGDDDVKCCTLRSGSGTWLSFGFHADSDDNASFLAASVRYQASHRGSVTLPEGYEDVLAFETAPMIITSGRVVVHSEGV